jgi:hypothetical protein
MQARAWTAIPNQAMGQIFPKGANSLARATLAFLGVGFFGFWGLGYAVYRSPYMTRVHQPIEQPVPFSHEHHVAGLGIDCRYCHSSVETSAFAGIPPTETCITCHSQVWREAPVLAPVRQSFASGQPLQWNRVHEAPDFVFFNHSIHVQKGIGCSTCHGQVDRMPILWKEHSLYMRWCLDCHEAPEKHLRPRDKIFDMNWQPPADQSIRGRELMQEYRISKQRLDQLRDCSMCHR